MEVSTKKNPILSTCGLNCGLCSRFYTKGTSRCDGCGGEKFTISRPQCGVIRCCKSKNIDYCYQCDEYPCSKYKNALKDSFITHQNIFKNFDEVKKIGIESYLDNLKKKMSILNTLLEKYDDGRRKTFYCLAINLLDISSIEKVMNHIDNSDYIQNLDIKAKAKTIISLFDEVAKEKNICLILNKE